MNEKELAKLKAIIEKRESVLSSTCLESKLKKLLPLYREALREHCLETKITFTLKAYLTWEDGRDLDESVNLRYEINDNGEHIWPHDKYDLNDLLGWVAPNFKEQVVDLEGKKEMVVNDLVTKLSSFIAVDNDVLLDELWNLENG